MELATPAVAIQQPAPGKRAKSVYDHSWWILDADVSKLFRTIGKAQICYCSDTAKNLPIGWSFCNSACTHLP